MSDTELESRAIREIKTFQYVIDTSVETLEGLRQLTTDEFTQERIRDTESKLIKLFSRIIIVKNKFASEELHDSVLAEYPKTQQWLSMVGISQDAIKGVLQRNISLYTLLEMSEEEVRNLLIRYDVKEEDIRGLNTALKNLKIWTERQLTGSNNNSSDSDIELHWTSYQPVSNSPYSDSSPRYGTGSRPSTSSLPPETIHAVQTHQMLISPQSTPSSPVPRTDRERYRYTPPPTPPIVRSIKPIGNAKYPSTPPPKKRNQLFPEYPLTRSKSQESQLANRVIDIDPVKPSKKKPKELVLTGSQEVLYSRRLSNESETGRDSRGPSGHASPALTSPVHSPPYLDRHIQDSNTLTVPKMTPKMMHQISHRFTTKIMIGSICDICHKNVFRGKICKDCRFKCHKDCAHKAAQSCGLPNQYVETFIHSVLEHGSPGQNRRYTNPNVQWTPNQDPLPSVRSVPVIKNDSSSASSCNSSTPSSPALVMSSGTITSPSPGPSPHVQIQFQFPDISESSTDMTQTEPLLSKTYDHDFDVVSTNTSNDSDKTLVDSNTSERTLLDRVDSVDSQDDPLGHSLNRVNSLSVALKEWDIPYEELTFPEDSVIGTGRFGTVYRATWHGDVAVKMLNMDPDSDNQAQLSAFKLEVAMLRKTRHENLVLFMGACMKPPHLGIVTSLCRGHSLYTLLHARKEKFQMNKTILIAQQVAQGMGYLHAKGLLHKDLKTKNIFLDRDKVVITDFGLLNVTKICHGNKKTEWLHIPEGWLCYLAPEIIRFLQAGSAYLSTDLPFSEQSDVYAFGTVWYELLCGEWPFKNLPAACVIWQVGRGIKQSLGSIKGSKEVKEVLIMCWSFKMEDRPSFSHMLKLLERLPKKPFSRSPSHPIHLLSRSAESILT